MIKVVCFTSDKYLWAVQPFMYLFNTYWSADQPIEIAGYTPPSFNLTRNANFFSIATPQYDKDRWADGAIQYLKRIDDDFLVIMLEDYWINRKVDIEGISILQNYMYSNPRLLRVDLTADRLYAGGSCDYESYDRFDLVQAKGSQYEMSLQAGLWNRLILIDVLEHLPDDCRSAWQVELAGTSLVNESPYLVLGTRQPLIRYTNGMNNALSGSINTSNIALEHLDIIRKWFDNNNRSIA